MKLILTCSGKSVKVSDEWFDVLSQYSWYVNSRGYVVRNSSRYAGKRKTILMHRIIMNPPDDLFVDHKDGDKLIIK